MTTTAPEKPAAAKKAPPAGTLMMLKLSQLKPADDNPRKEVGDVTELAESMGELGVLEPFVAVQQNGHYLIVAGARRYAAATLAGLAEVPVLVRELTDEQRVKAMLIENLQREDLTPLEEAAAYQRLVAEFEVSQRTLATSIGRSQGHISKRLALLALPDAVRAQVDSGGITIADAVELTRLAKHPSRLQAAVSGPTYQSIAGRVEAQLKEIANEELLVAREEELESAAIPTVRVANEWQLGAGRHPILDENGDSFSFDALKIKPSEHALFGCHAIALHINYQGKLHEFSICTDRSQHPKIKTRSEAADRLGRHGGPTKAELKARQELEQAQERRREFIGALLAKKPARPLAVDAITTVLVSMLNDWDDAVLDLACQWLGIEITPDLAAILDGPVELARIGVGPHHLIAYSGPDEDGGTEYGAHCGVAGEATDIRTDVAPLAIDVEVCGACCSRVAGESQDSYAALIGYLQKNEASALHAGLAVALATHEQGCESSWRWQEGAGVHFARLEQLGYEISDAERAKVAEVTA